MIKEKDLVALGFSKSIILGTGTWRNPIEQYYYQNGNLTINATMFWTWFVNGEQDNSVSVADKISLIDLLKKVNRKCFSCGDYLFHGQHKDDVRCIDCWQKYENL